MSPCTKPAPSLHRTKLHQARTKPAPNLHQAYFFSFFAMSCKKHQATLLLVKSIVRISVLFSCSIGLYKEVKCHKKSYAINIKAI